MPLEFVKSIRGHDLLVHNGFTFALEKTKSDKKIWKFTEYRTKKCNGRCHTSNGQILKSTSHSHVPDSAKIETRRIMASMKERAEETVEATHQIVASSTRSFGFS